MNIHTYDFHIGDYARDTTHLSLLEHGVYRLLLDRTYTENGHLPLDTKNLSRKIGARTEREEKAVETILTEFFQKTPTGWTHKRVQEELGEMRLRSAKSKYSQLCRWYDKKEWPDKPTLEAYLAEPTKYYDPTTGHIRNPNDRNTTVSRRITLQPPTANRQPPTATIIIAPEGHALETASKPSSQKRDQSFETLVRLQGSNLSALSKTERGSINAALKAIRQAAPDLDDETLARTITGHAAQYAIVMPDGTGLTATALAKHWSRLTPGAQKKNNGGAAPAAHPLALPPCNDWKTLARHIAQQAGTDDLTWIDTANWNDIASDDRQAIVDAHKQTLSTPHP